MLSDNLPQTFVMLHRYLYPFRHRSIARRTPQSPSAALPIRVGSFDSTNGLFLLDFCGTDISLFLAC